MNNLMYGYYNSPIGILQLCCNDKDELLSLLFKDSIDNKESDCSFLKNVKKQLDGYFDGTLKEFDIKLNFNSGTEFRQKVWTALLNIPYGKTASYKDIAIAINNEKAVRAVGSANGKNPFGIIVPCHRVIGANNTLVGYTGGMDKKVWLLEHEQQHF